MAEAQVRDYSSKQDSFYHMHYTLLVFFLKTLL